MDKITVFKAQQWAFSFINKHQKEKSAAELLLRGQFGWNTTQLLMHYQDELSHREWTLFKQNVEKYCQGWPAQYLLGQAQFFGLGFKVTPATLIPRQETEELVEWILDDEPKKGAKVLDIGTGTGAIGLTLKHERPDLDVTLSDISSDALAVAKENATNLGTEVKLKQGDLFENITGQFDIIVSNPPYIAESERELMDESVLLHEPELALFAPDEGLYLYKRLAQEITPYLSPRSRLYLEIGFAQGPRVVALFEKYFPQAQVELKHDLSEKARMIRVKF